MKKIYALMMLVMSLLVGQSAQALTYTVTVPAGTEACFIAGGMNGWSITRMTKVDGVDNQFTIDYPNAAETDGYKYLSGPDWKYEEVIDADRNWTAEQVVASWKETFQLDERTVTINVWTPMDVYEIYITGAFNNWTGVFNQDNKMTYVGEEDGGKVFSFEVNYFDAYGMEFKFVAGPDWAFEQVQKDNFKYETTENAKNMIMQTDAFKDIFNPDKAGIVTITATVPAGTEEVWLQGSLFGWSWDNADAMKMTKNADGTFSFTTGYIQSMEYRLYNGAGWDFPEVGEDNPTDELKPNRAINALADGPNVAITVWGWKSQASGMNDASADAFSIYTNGNSIVVEGAASQVELYNIAGSRILSQAISGTYTSAPLTPGLYIIAIDGVAQKVIIK